VDVARGGRAAAASPRTSPPVQLAEGLGTLDEDWQRLGRCAARHDATCARAAFGAARASYKSHEALLELLAPVAAAALNGRRQEIDDDDAPPPGTTASAFESVETALPFLDATHGGGTASADWDAAASAARAAHATLAVLRRQAADFRVSRAQRFEAVRLELARVVALGVTGFDTPHTHAGVAESATALRRAAALVRDVPAASGAVARIEAAAARLDATPEFDAFNRLAFVVGWSEPALTALRLARDAAGVPPLAMPRAWVGATLFGRNSIDPRAFAPSYAPPASPPLVALGARLFAEPALSGPGTRSCATCHDPARAFADGRLAPLSLGNRTVTLRNTPSLLQAAFEPALFADARAVTLEDQAAAVLASPAEMGGSAELAAARLSEIPAYRAAFAAAFDRSAAAPAAAVVTSRRLRVALAAYVRSLGRVESRVDLAFRGDTLALDAEERRGATLFLGRAGCGTCHYVPLFAGATPPLYRSVDAEVLGVPARDGRALDRDPGRGAVDGRSEHRHAFKTPSLRNVALTGPYMHNGALRTLADVVAFYDRGGGHGLGLEIPNQTLPDRRLHLDAGERRALVAFLRALTDTALAAPR
jgi:cytochrome c peroxidase